MDPTDTLTNLDASAPQAGNVEPAAWRDRYRERLLRAIGFLRRLCAVVALRLWTANTSVVRRLRVAWSLRAVRVAATVLAALVVLPPVWAFYYVYLDRSRVPDLEPFLRFEPPRIGEVYDARGKVLIELAHEYRRVVAYDEVPVVVREAVLAAEDKNFFSHSGVDYSALPRVIQKTTVRSLTAWWNGARFRLLLPQGGSTLTQQLVRAYFLRERTSQQDGDILFHDGWPQRILAAALGVPATNKLLRKLEEVRLALWLEEEMRRRYGTKEQAKREIFARSASFHYVGNGRYGLAAGSEYYFGKPLASYTVADAAKAASLAGISKSPRAYAPTPGNARSLRRRNQILALMARNGSIPEGVAKHCQTEPVRVMAHSPLQTDAPAVIEDVFSELNKRGGSSFGVEDLFQGRISVRSTVDERVQVIVNKALENGLDLYEKRHPRTKGLASTTTASWDARRPGRARRRRSSARSCSASTRTSWWGRCRSSLARSRMGSTSTWRCRRTVTLCLCQSSAPLPWPRHLWHRR